MSLEQLTDQQRNAVEMRGVCVVLSSGAGCGKTHVLTNRYLTHLIEDRAEVSAIVAMTFTDRAAREMRDRIRQALHRRRAESPDNDDWERHLRALESAPICTIHSFCSSLLRQFSAEAGLDPAFEVYQEHLAAGLRRDSIRSSLRNLLVDNKPEKSDLHELIVLFGRFAVENTLDSLLRNPETVAWNEWVARDPESILHDWLAYRHGPLLQAVVEFWCNGDPQIAQTLTILRRTECLGPKTKANITHLLTEMPRLAENSDKLASLREQIIEWSKVVRSESAKAWSDTVTAEFIKDRLEKFRKSLKEQIAFFIEEPEEPLEAIRIGQRFLRVALRMNQEFLERKQRLGVVDFSDLLLRTRDLLRSREDVRTALQRRFRYVLVDELQDTDPVQMEIVRILCGGSFHHDRLFAVGDHKQSIYRFRNADVQLFLDLRRSIPDEGRLPLTCNFRSQRPILDFVNALFAASFPEYEPLEAHHPAVSPEPCIEFLWSIGSDQQIDRDDDERTDKPTAGEQRELEASLIADRITALLHDQTLRILDEFTQTPRRIQAGDIVILFRSMSNVAIYENALRNRGLDYYLVGGRAFFAQQEVYDFLNLLRAVENPQDAASLAGVLRSPFCCLSDEALFVLSLHPRGLWAGLLDESLEERLPSDQVENVHRARKNLRSWHSMKDHLPIARFLGRVLYDSGYDAALQFEFLGDRKLANVWKLLDLAREFDQSGIFSAAEFIERLAELVKEQPREEQAATQPENADVIRMMTIHQAKGLEFPVVILADLNSRTQQGRYDQARWDRALGCLVRPPSEETNLFSDFGHRLGMITDIVAEREEDLRILYVACTRPRDLLILSASFLEADFPRNDTPIPPTIANSRMLLLSERFNLRTGESLVANIPTDRRPIVRVYPFYSSGALPFPLSNVATSNTEESNERSFPRFPTPPNRIAGHPPLLSLPAIESLARSNRNTVPVDPFAPLANSMEGLYRLAPHFDSEEGFEIDDWPTPRRRIGNYDLSSPHDFACLHFYNACENLEWSNPNIEAVPDDSLRQLLQLLIESPLRMELIAASEERRDVEFQTRIPGLDHSAVIGLIDLLWRDGTGERNFALYDFEPITRPESARWESLRPFVAVRAWAIHEVIGSWPATVVLYHVPTGTIRRQPLRERAIRHDLDGFVQLTEKLLQSAILF